MIKKLFQGTWLIIAVAIASYAALDSHVSSDIVLAMYPYPDDSHLNTNLDKMLFNDVHYNKFVGPTIDSIESVLDITFSVSLAIIFVKLSINFTRHWGAGFAMGFSKICTYIRSLLQSRMAEREFIRFKKLYEAGLMNEQEFNLKKESLKEKILN